MKGMAFSDQKLGEQYFSFSSPFWLSKKEKEKVRWDIFKL